MRREPLPWVLLQQMFAERDLTRSGQIHRVIPGDFAVTDAIFGAVRRWTVRLLAAVALPDAVGAVGMACSAVHHADPKHGARDRKSTRLNSSHLVISYAVFCL